MSEEEKKEFKEILKRLGINYRETSLGEVLEPFDFFSVFSFNLTTTFEENRTKLNKGIKDELYSIRERILKLQEKKKLFKEYLRSDETNGA
jgi:hypothetical protein